MCADNRDSDQPAPTTPIRLLHITVTSYDIGANYHAQALFITCLIKNYLESI